MKKTIHFSIIAKKESFYIFGGRISDSINLEDPSSNLRNTRTIAAFNTITRKWILIGKMQKARAGHGVILHDGDFLIIGGWRDACGFERCSLHRDSIRCYLVGGELKDCSIHPSMMLISENTVNNYFNADDYYQRNHFC